MMLSIIVSTSAYLTNGLRLGLDLKGGFEILYEATPLESGSAVTQDSLVQTARSLEGRIDKHGTSEPEVLPEGENRIRVRIAGVDNEKELRETLVTPAEL